MIKLTLQDRLNCPHSYAEEETNHLMCEMGGVCDGTLYQECLIDRSFDEQMRLAKECQTDGCN